MILLVEVNQFQTVLHIHPTCHVLMIRIWIKCKGVYKRLTLLSLLLHYLCTQNLTGYQTPLNRADVGREQCMLNKERHTGNTRWSGLFTWCNTIGVSRHTNHYGWVRNRINSPTQTLSSTAGGSCCAPCVADVPKIIQTDLYVSMFHCQAKNKVDIMGVEKDKHSHNVYITQINGWFWRQQAVASVGLEHCQNWPNLKFGMGS